VTTTTDDREPLTGVLVPIRSFDDALSRLSGVLDHAARARLMRTLAQRVVEAARDLPVWIVTDDPDVAEWASDQGAVPLAVERSGLTESVSKAVEVLRRRGLDRVIVAHADLALVDDLTGMDGPGVSIAPDRRQDGSNVICIPADSGFRFAYGPGSFDRHVAEARRLDLPVRVVDDPTLAIDIDEPADLSFVEAQGELE
jgi:2-phospho-L-lactate guanylyltransferase